MSWLTARPGRWAPLLVFGVAVALYAPNLRNGFAWDDDYLVVDNPAVHALDRAPSWFTEPWSAGSRSAQGRRQNALYWRPLTQASYALDWVLSGGEPWLFHLTNDLLHGLASALVTLLTLVWWRRRREADKPVTGGAEAGGAEAGGAEAGGAATGDARPARRDPDGTDATRPALAAALCAGLLFAVHPVHTEAVNLATYRTTLLAATGALAALYLHCAGRGWPSSLLAALCFALGLMGKENAIVLPGLALLCDAALGRLRALRWRAVWRLLPLLVVAAAYLLLHRSLTGPPQLDFFAGATRYQVVLTMLKVVSLDVQLLFIPHPLTPFYDWTIFPVATTAADVEVIAGALLLALLLLVLLVALARGWAIPGLTIGSFLIALAPYSHVIPFFDVAGERFLYLPSAGVCAGAGLGLGYAVARGFRPRVLLALAAAVIVAFGALTVARTPHFASTHALLAETARLFPNGFATHYYLGLSWLERGRPREAARALKRAHAIMPGIEPCTLALTDALVRSGRPAEARALLYKELQRLGREASPRLRRRLDALSRRLDDPRKLKPAGDSSR